MVEQVERAAAGVVMHVRAAASSVPCPGCGQSSRRVHGRYERRLRDVALGGTPVVIVLRVRRFVCCVTGCTRRTFTEQVDGLTTPHARFSLALRAALTSIAVMLAGRAGSRLAATLGMPACRDTLLGLLRAVPDPPVATVRVLGVDDFALRRRHVYGTVLINMDTGQPVDVLADRTAETFAAWLLEHPGVKIVCRDGAAGYASGAAAGAPGAVQVLDRWHVWQNLCKAVEKAVARHREALNEPVTADQSDRPVVLDRSSASDLLPPGSQPGVPAPEGRLAMRSKHRHAQVRALREKGLSISRIARELHLDRKTVRKFANADTAEKVLARKGRTSIVDDYAEYLWRRWNDGCTDGQRLFEEIRTMGFRGSDQAVRRFIQPWRQGLFPPLPKSGMVKARQAAGWIVTDPDNLGPEQQQQLDHVLERSPALDRVSEHVREFAKMMKTLTGQRLPAWIDNVLADDLPDLHGFAMNLRRDLDAAVAGLTLPWNSGRVEGNVNRIKMIKRQMFGRAKFGLLRKRILLRS